MNPVIFLSCNNIYCDLMQQHRDIDNLYKNFVFCLHQAAKAKIPHPVNKCNQHVKTAHFEARDASVLWVNVPKYVKSKSKSKLLY